MHWEAISAVSEAAGLIAIVISLLYLASQIRFARLAAADLSRQARVDGIRENVIATLSTPSIRENWLKASQSDQTYERLGNTMGISPDAAFQVEWMCLSWMWVHWGQYRSIKTSDDLDELKHVVELFYSTPPMSTCWSQGFYGKEGFDEDFVLFIEGCLAKSKDR